MKKKKVNLDDLEVGKEYQVTTVPAMLTGIDHSAMLGIEIYIFTPFDDAPNDIIKLHAGEIDTIREVEEK